MAVIQSWPLLTTDGHPYTISVTDNGQTGLTFASTLLKLDPITLTGALQQAALVVANLQAVTDPTTLTVGTDIFTCDLRNGHDQKFHHDPRGFFWLGAN